MARRRRRSVGAKPPHISPHTRFSRRTLALTVCFVALCVTYAAILISLGAKGNAYSVYVEQPDLPAGYTRRVETVSAVRGEIYDRNGVPLVTNRTSYSLVLDYPSFVAAGDAHTRNAILLSLSAELELPTGGTVPARSWPYEGSYPDLTLSSAIETDSALQRDFERVRKAAGLPAGASGSDVLSHYLESRGLTERAEGMARYSDRQIDTLLRLYYDMDAKSFSTYAPYVLSDGVPTALIARLKEAATPGVRFPTRTERVYHYPGYAAHLLGYIGAITEQDWDYYRGMGYSMDARVGRAGCELAFESILRGQDGSIEYILDDQGRTVEQNVLTTPFAGQDIYLTIDINAQIAAEDALAAAIAAGQASAGALVAQDPGTGEVLVLASAPTYDISSFFSQYTVLASDPARPLTNRALSASYLAGDMMYPAVALAALSEGKISSGALLPDNGRLDVGTSVFLCSRLMAENRTHGPRSVTEALRDRCEVVFATLGLSLGDETLDRWERALGLGQRTGIETGEQVGSSSGIYPGIPAAVATAAIGQGGARLSPAQLNVLLATLLNGGERTGAHVLLEVRDHRSGELVLKTPTTTLSSISVAPAHRAVLTDALQATAQSTPALAPALATLQEEGYTAGTYSALTPAADGKSQTALSWVTLSRGAETLCLTTVLEHAPAAVFADTVGLQVARALQ